MKKNCNRCNNKKEIREFHKNPNNADGYLNQCKNCVSLAHKKFYAENKERFKEPRKKRYWETREKSIKDAVEWGKKNKGKRKIIRAKWRDNNRELANHLTKTWYPRSIGSKGDYTLDEFKQKLEKFGGKCAYCRSNIATTRDHIIPISRKGTNTIDNINPSCLSCNDKKGTKLLSEWKY